MKEQLATHLCSFWSGHIDLAATLMMAKVKQRAGGAISHSPSLFAPLFFTQVFNSTSKKIQDAGIWMIPA